MTDKEKNYFNFKIEDIDKNPEYKWDFSRMHKAYSFNLSWVDKYPNKSWDFKLISRWGKFTDYFSFWITVTLHIK